MATKRKTHNNRKFIKIGSAVILILLIVAGIGSYYKFKNNDKSSLTTTKSSTLPEDNYGTTPAPPADNAPNESRKTSPPSNNETLIGNSGSSTSSTQASYTVQIVSASVNNGNLHIGTLVSGTTTGNCTLTASKNGQSTLSLGTSTVKLDVSNYDCGVFNIATSQFPVSGNWQLTLTVSNNTQTASASKSVDIANGG